MLILPGGFMYFMIYYKSFPHSELQNHQLHWSCNSTHLLKQDFIRHCYPKNKMFRPKRASQKSVYQWSAALTLFTENHSSPEQLMENKSPWRLITINVFICRGNQDRKFFWIIPVPLWFLLSLYTLGLIVFLLFLCQISVSVYLSDPWLSGFNYYIIRKWQMGRQV